MDEVGICRACGSTDLQPAGPPIRRVVCGRCGRCWDDEGDGPEVDVIACPGCARRGTCEARPTWLAESLTQRHVLADGGLVLIRPLVYGDRFELSSGFTELSLRSRQLRFFQPLEALGEDAIEYLTNIDYEEHFAFAALLLGGPSPEGIGVGRYLRDPADPGIAEVAVTVVDGHQRRGVGTLLVRALGDVAVERGIHAFVSYVQWDNDLAVESLRREGARVLPAEPGIARIEIDLPGAMPESFVRRVLTASRAHLAGVQGALAARRR
ncbi:MAG TPA: GNAT family N-acetyltransferase [Acidimicrobiales bacterium]|nr:GNAT family N-acetyltransferase [Acidimicrobiales bacterium]